MECITSDISRKYIYFLSKKGANITEYENIVVYGSVSRRQIGNYAQGLLNKILNFKGNPPYFIILTLLWTDQGDKHSVTLIVDENYNIHIFDSNGPINCSQKVTERLCKIIVELQYKMSDYFQEKVDIVDDMKGLKNINTVGTGNCDALSLWYISQRFFHPLKAKKILEKLESQMYPTGVSEKEAASRRLRIINEINRKIITKKIV